MTTIKSFKEFGEVAARHTMEEEEKVKKKYKQQEVKLVEPINLRQLVEHKSPKEIGDLFGCSSSHISSSLRDNEIRPLYELAAEAILRNIVDGPQFYIVQVPKEKTELFETFVAGLQVSVAKLDV